MLHHARKWLICVCFLVLSHPALTENRNAFDTEYDKILEAYSEQSITDKDVTKLIKWSGHSRDEIFAIAQARLLNDYNITKGKKRGRRFIEINSWRLQLLGISGNEKYRETITRFTKTKISKKLQRHANNSLLFLDDFSRWNTEIAKNLAETSKEQLELVRVSNMINSQDFKLVRAGASTVYHRHFKDPQFTDLAYTKLKTLYLSTETDNRQADAAAWLAKAIGKSENKDYSDFLLEVKKNANSKHLRKWADKAYDIKHAPPKRRYGPT